MLIPGSFCQPLARLQIQWAQCAYLPTRKIFIYIIKAEVLFCVCLLAGSGKHAGTKWCCMVKGYCFSDSEILVVCTDAKLAI